MVFSTKLGAEIDADEGTSLNSNLLPVKANGEVLFLSVESFVNRGNVDTPVDKGDLSL